MSASTTASTGAVFAAKAEGPWLFGRTLDLVAFGGSALVSLALVAVGASLGILELETPHWVWIGCILVFDVAHVWSTVFRVYLDGEEVRRRPVLYLGLPVACYVLAVMVHAMGSATFWTVLAYLAVFHFVRQQYGWLALYRRRAGERERFERWLDTATIYTATLYPVLFWHAHLPRHFTWFVEGDFITGLAAPVADALLPLYWGLLALFVGRQLYLLAKRRPVNTGKVVLVLSTWACWWVGIMALDSDFAFTVTNVLIHGAPYLVLTYRYGRARGARAPGRLIAKILRGGALAFVAVAAGFAFIEELLWDRYVWHDREWLFGSGVELDGLWLTLLVPLLSVPQLTHYALDAVVWKVRGNPTLAVELAPTAGSDHVGGSEVDR